MKYCGVLGQRPIHIEHAYLRAIPRHDSGDEDRIQEIMTAIGKIESFDDTKDNWETCVVRVEQFFLANPLMMTIKCQLC